VSFVVDLLSEGVLFMRRRIRFRLVDLSAGLALLAMVGCLGHLIEKAKGQKTGPGEEGGICDLGLGNSPLVATIAPSDRKPTAGTTNGSGECSASMPSEPTRPGYAAARDPEVADLIRSMSLDSKIKQMYGIAAPPQDDTSKYNDIERSYDVPSGAGTRQVRGWKYRDAGRGVNLAQGQKDRPSQGKDYATAFPVQSARAASWDVDMEMRVGEAMGEETMTSTNNMLLAPCMNIIRHPYWGRNQETYGEDMYHVGRMASALAAGIQKHVAACAKHFAANNIENNRANQNAQMTEQALRESFTRHFEMVVKDGGVACIMAAYNSVNSKKCTQNEHLLTDILRNDFGYRGLVISDWWAMPGNQGPVDTQTAQAQATEAVKAGLDIEVPWALNMSQVGALVDKGALTLADVNTSVERILEQKFRFKTTYTDDAYGICQGVATLNGPGTDLSQTTLSSDSITNNDEHLKLAEESEIESAVLLANGTSGAPVLPIGSSVTKIAVVGIDVNVKDNLRSTTPPSSGDTLNLATQVNIGDRGSSRVNADPAKSIGPCDGIKAAAASHNIPSDNVTCGNSVDAAGAQNADFVVVVVGLTAVDEGEEYSLASYGDRDTLDLPYNQADLVNQVLGLSKPTAVIIEAGSIVNVPWISRSNHATIWAGYGGEHQGNAFGKLLFGDRNFSGKMAVSWPQQSDLPEFRSAAGETTDESYYFGYRHYDHLAANGDTRALVFPFGWGMSYTTFQYSNLQVPCGSVKKNGVANVTVDVANTGTIDGDEVVMMFVAGPPKPAGITGERPVKELKRFQRVTLKKAGDASGEDAKRVTLPLDVQDLRHWEGAQDGSWVIDEGQYTIMVGPDAAHLPLTGTITVHN
jgi:beta-glucosidase